MIIKPPFSSVILFCATIFGVDYCYLCASKITYMDIAIKAGQLILALAILVTVHEFGHYLAARAFKTRVEKFYLFFNPWFSVFKKKIGDTEWGLGWLPLGGYVKISGMIDESMDTEQMKQDPQPWEFRSKPAWQRLIIMLGGIIVNLILGFAIYIFILWGYGKTIVPAESNGHGVLVGEVLQKYGFQNGDEIVSMGGQEIRSLDQVGKGIMLRGQREFQVLHSDGSESTILLPADVEYEIFQTEGMNTVSHRYLSIIGAVVDTMEAGKKGVLAGDVVKAVNGIGIMYWDELTTAIQAGKSSEIQLTVARSGEMVDLLLEVDSTGRIGIQLSDDLAAHGLKKEKIDYSFGQAMGAGFGFGYQTLRDYVVSLKFIFTSKGATGLGGIGTIANLYGSKWVWHDFWMTTAFLSFMLAFLNLLPIPALDGGHVAFLTVEMITGKPLPQKFMEYAQTFGIILLLGLMLYANGLDILRGLGLWK
jgi:regulator of sigma E protease